MRSFFKAVAVMAALAPAMIGGGAVAQSTGSLVIMGGAMRNDNAPVWTRYAELAGGKGAKIAIIPAASGSPQRNGERLAKALEAYGLQATVLQIGPRYKDVDYKKAAADPENVAKIKASTGIFFLGGDQGRITQSLLTEDGKNTPVLDAIWEVYRKGGVIGGTSAGAAIMSKTMFKDPPDLPIDILKFGFETGKTIDRGLGFLENGWFVDQHFLARGRWGRSLAALVADGNKFGFGVDEDTAAIVKGNDLEVVGRSGVVVMDVSDAKATAGKFPFAIEGAKVSYLDRGDKFDLASRKITPGGGKDIEKDKIDPNSDKFDPYYTSVEYFTNVFAKETLVEAMANLIDSKQKQHKGLGFVAAEGVKSPEIGFEVTFRKGADSLGWFSSSTGVESYTVQNIYVDLKPVKLAQPLYQPLP